MRREGAEQGAGEEKGLDGLEVRVGIWCGRRSATTISQKNRRALET